MTNLTHLESFVEVAIRGSFASAARYQNLPRSTVTARVKALESALGVVLFQRTTRQVRLTAEGESYLAKVQPALSVLEEAGEDLKASQTPSGLVRMTVPVDLPAGQLAEVLARFQVDFPFVELEVHISDRVVDVIGERFDLALRGNRVEDENVIIRKVGASRQIVVARPDVAECRTVKELARLGRVLDNAKVLEETFGFQVKPSGFKTSNKQLAKQIVLNSNVAAVLPRVICEEELETGNLREIGDDLVLPDLPLFVVLPSARFVPKRVRLLVDYLVTFLGS